MRVVREILLEPRITQCDGPEQADMLSKGFPPALYVSEVWVEIEQEIYRTREVTTRAEYDASELPKLRHYIQRLIRDDMARYIVELLFNEHERTKAARDLAMFGTSVLKQHAGGEVTYVPLSEFKTPPDA